MGIVVRISGGIDEDLPRYGKLPPRSLANRETEAARVWPRRYPPIKVICSRFTPNSWGWVRISRAAA